MKDYKQWVNSKIPKVNRTIIQVYKDRYLDKQNYKKLKKVLKNQDYYLIYKLNTVKQGIIIEKDIIDTEYVQSVFLFINLYIIYLV